MHHLFWITPLFSLLPCCATNLYAYESIENHANYSNSRVTDERVEKLQGYCYEAVDAVNRNEMCRARGLFFTITREVESMMAAKIKIEQFLDDAFEQAEKKGAKFSNGQKNYFKSCFGVQCKGNDLTYNLSNYAAYQRYEDQPSYEANARLEAGLMFVIIGGVVSVIPRPGCWDTGKWMIGLGVGLMVDACIQGQEKKDIRQDRYR